MNLLPDLPVLKLETPNRLEPRSHLPLLPGLRMTFIRPWAKYSTNSGTVEGRRIYKQQQLFLG